MSVKTVEFSRSFLFPWVKGRISLEDRMVKTRRVHTVLGIIPAGTDNQTMPLSNISAVGVNTRYNIKTILIGAALAVGGVLCLTGSFLLALVLLLAGVAFIGSGILTEINFSKGGGSVYPWSSNTVSGAHDGTAPIELRPGSGGYGAEGSYTFILRTVYLELGDDSGYAEEYYILWPPGVEDGRGGSTDTTRLYYVDARGGVWDMLYYRADEG